MTGNSNFDYPHKFYVCFTNFATSQDRKKLECCERDVVAC